MCHLPLLLLVLLGSVLPAAERGFIVQRRTEGGYVALVIGNGAYPDARLGNPANDATDVTLALKGVGFTVETLTDVDREQMALGLERFKTSLPRAKAAVFYYAGHGVQVQGENWLLPIGRTPATQITDETQVPSRAISAGEVLLAMEQAKVPMNLVVLDACRNNPFKGGGRGRVQGLAELRAPVGSLILYATAAGRTAADGAGRNSPFTSAFLRHLSTPGLDIRYLPSEITNTVIELTSGVQVPWTSTSLRQGFCFCPPLSDEEKFAAEKARKEEQLRQEEMQAQLRDLAAQARAADAAKQTHLAEERKRVEVALAASQKESVAISKQLEADLQAAREREQTELADARRKADAVLAAKQAEITALDAKIAALKEKKSDAGTDADLDALVATMNERKTRREELARLEREAQAQRAQAAAEAERKRKEEEAQAAARRKKAEDEAAAQREQVRQQEEAKRQELARLRQAERQALADRLEKDLVKYRQLATSEDGKDLAPVAWAKICGTYQVAGVAVGKEAELWEKVVPGMVKERAAAAEVAPWSQAVGMDLSGSWAKLVVGDQTQVMRLIPAGCFQMGSANGDSDEKPVHSVKLSTFWLADSECTQGLWRAVMGSTPIKFTDAANPIEHVSWNDCQEFLKELNRQVPGLRSCLPSEAQWEYACRAGSMGDFVSDLDALAWYDKNSGNQRHPVKMKRANAWGLYDMHGNVWEWCADWSAAYTGESQHDPTGPLSGSDRVFRGGGWFSIAGGCRAAYRYANAPASRVNGLGFRFAALASALPSREISR